MWLECCCWMRLSVSNVCQYCCCHCSCKFVLLKTFMCSGQRSEINRMTYLSVILNNRFKYNCMNRTGIPLLSLLHISAWKCDKRNFMSRKNINMCDFRFMPQSRWTALFWVITQRVVVISYWHFGKTYRSHLQDRTDRLSQKVDGTYRLSWKVGKKLPPLAA